MSCVIALDAGTTGVRAAAVDEQGRIVELAYRELEVHYPRPGWVEQDAGQIWTSARAVLDEVGASLQGRGEVIAAIGVTNQRESVVAWDRSSGAPLYRAIVWQDRRTAWRCKELAEAGLLPTVRRRTGLVLDPYFSATKMQWLLAQDQLRDPRTLSKAAMGTVDAWLVWNLTGGADGGVLCTDPTNASRTMLYDIGDHAWSVELCEAFGVPRHLLPEVRPSCGRVGLVAPGATHSGLAGVPIAGIAGDQQAALFGQACFAPGMTKVTYGTGTFVLMTWGEDPPEPPEGLLVTVAWHLGMHGGPLSRPYALEGSALSSGAAIQWLRDQLGVIERADEVGALASSVPDAGGMTVVPAFTGLGSPWWDPAARGTIVGVTRGAGRAALSRGVVEAMAYQVRDIVEAMKSAGAPPIAALRADGGASVMDVLLQLQADQLQVRVARPASIETTAVGAALLAGLGEGLWPDLETLGALWERDADFVPLLGRDEADAAYGVWRRAVERSRGWAAR